MEIDLSKLTPDIRHLDDMREVLYDKDFVPMTSSSRILNGETVGTKNSGDIELY